MLYGKYSVYIESHFKLNIHCTWHFPGPPLDAELAALEEAERRRGDGPDLHPGFIQENIVVLPLEPKQGRK